MVNIINRTKSNSNMDDRIRFACMSMYKCKFEAATQTFIHFYFRNAEVLTY